MNANDNKPVDVLAVMALSPDHLRVLREYARDTGSFRVNNAGATELAAACGAAIKAAEAHAAVANLIERVRALQLHAGRHEWKMVAEAVARVRGEA